MSQFSLIIFGILFGSLIAQSASESSASNYMNLKMCTANETIAVQVLVNHNSSGMVCQCQAGQTDDPTTNEDYIYTPGIGTHKLHTNAKSWNEARKVCNRENAHLAIINSKAEEALLVGLLNKAERRIKGGLNTEEALLGIHDLYEEGEWVTIFGESIFSTGFSSWSPTYWGGQPDNMGGNQNCGAIINQGGMDDVNCNDKFAFFCELPSTC